jgi:hypothetical protein
VDEPARWGNDTIFWFRDTFWFMQWILAWMRIWNLGILQSQYSSSKFPLDPSILDKSYFETVANEATAFYYLCT